MAGIVVRPYEAGDREGFFHVRAITYNDGQPIPAEDQVFKTHDGFVGVVDGEIGGVFSVLDLTCTRGEAVLRTAGIAGVAVLPEMRQSGVGHAMMSSALGLLREQGYLVASLYGFRESYYRKFGYEMCGQRWRIKCPNERLPKVNSTLPVRTIPFSSYRLLDPCLEVFAKQRSGMSLRNDKLWGRIVDEKKTIYVIGDPIEAYAIVSHEVNFWTDQNIQECAWSTARGHEGLMGLFRGIGVNKTSVTWSEPSDGLFAARYADQGVEIGFYRPIMFRILDVPGALRALKPGEDGEFSVLVEDELVPENRGPWRVVARNGLVEVESTSDFGLRCSIQSFTQAFLGEPSLERLGVQGVVQVSDPLEFQAACRVLGAMPVYCMEFF